MDDQSVASLVSRMAALVETFDRRCVHTSEQLREVVKAVPGAVKQSADEQLRALPREVVDSVRTGIGQPVAAYEQRLRLAGEQLQRASQALAAQVQRAESLHRHLVWKMVATTLGGLVLLWGGGAWLSTHYYREISRNQISAELLQAYNRADVTLCGDQLCAKVNGKDKRFGAYLPVKPR
ncbi:hypothetical protein [Variovorax sp.]|uniref:hypothetical protein n=1 Tax=Variovorax sp. TaxID=1871043 RepID=UPI002D6FB18D|nr:hypothetical protein [Variovorax sp.]HYP84803.1 hypothetical protein [Variovorax sp.]